MNIKNIPTNTVNSAQNEALKPNAKAAAGTESHKTATATVSADKVTLTVTTQQAKSLEKKMDDAKVDNSEKIKALKLAIESGSYEVDTDAVAKKLIQTERAFSQAQQATR